jgi:hypothetical protein
MATGRQRKATPKKRKASKGTSEAGAHAKYLGHYGWMPDVPDQRDLVFTAARAVTHPPAVDLRPGCPPIYDQGQLGSCTANAIGAAIEYEQIRQKEAKPFAPSRLFIYYNERVMEHTVGQDAGAQIRDGMKSVNQIGACPEADWPYVIANFSHKPPLGAFKNAPLGKAVSYQRVIQTLDQMKGCLAAGFPIVLGFPCMSRSSRSRSPAPGSYRCRPAARSSWAVMPFSPSAITMRTNGSSCGTPGAPRGE